MSIQVISSGAEMLARLLDEMAELTSKPTFSTRDEKRHNALLLEVSLLKKGMSPSEIRGFEQERLLKAAGLPKLPERPRGRMEEDDDHEWREFAKGHTVRSSYIPDKAETRASEAGEQTISYTQLIPGGGFVPNGIHNRLFETQKQYDQLYDEQFSNIVETPTGQNTAFPIWDDVASASTIITETSVSSEVDIAAFGNTQLGTYNFRSGIVGISYELLEDSNWPLGTVLERIFAYRHARGGAQYLATGTGTNQPMGLVTGAINAGAAIRVASGASANDGGAESGATSVGSADLWACYQSLNAAYRPGACWAMNDLTLLSISEQLDKQGRTLVSWRKGLTDVDADTPYLLGKKVAISPSMAGLSSGSNSIVCYNPLYFVQRRVPSATYVQRFAQSLNLVTYGLVGFQSYLRMSSALVAPNASYVPASIIQNHS